MAKVTCNTLNPVKRQLKKPMLTKLIIISILFTNAYAQVVKNDITDFISHNERLSHQRLQGDYAQRANDPQSNFDVKYYRCEWSVDPAIRYIDGKITVYYLVSTSTSSLLFDMANILLCDSVHQRNISLQTLHTDNILQVNLSANIDAGKLDSLTIYYHGTPANTGFGSFIQSTHAGVPVVWTLSEPYGSRDWWPCKNGLDDKADSVDIFVTHPSQYKAASNGLLQSEIVAGNRSTTHWKHKYPIATYLVCFAVTNYAVFNNTVQLGNVSLPMQTFCYPEDLATFQANTPLVLNAMKLYDSTFGRYPFIKEKYGHVQFGWGGGQEHQTSTFIVSPDESLMAHELAHQWFGDKITCGSWHDIWLNEGFATFLASLYMEKKYPANAIAIRKNEIENITAVPTGSVWVDDTSNVSRIFDGRLSYRKGSHVLYMLKWLLGDEIFLKGIQQYLTNANVNYGFARTDDLKKNLEEVSKKDLTYFFDNWIYGQGFPSYNIEWKQLSADYVKIKIQQTTAHSSVSFFRLHVALLFKNSTQQKTIVIDNTENNQQFFQQIDFVADTALIDPEYWLISRNNVSKKITEQVAGQNNFQVFPNPAKDIFFIYLQNFALKKATLTIHNAAAQLMYMKPISLFNNSYFQKIQSKNFSPGVYFLSISSGHKIIITKQVIIKN